ncbi:F0F1 ATP synthase subunit A [Geoalkalibacter halelectricus]|uniref:ATP synthase subunit a n=1 Tax=Geoalkalibacter halelectricus TaxID=2847045 RepID=A0ABY5ZL63_9BACT|nr:F0F1 ATP synthase subunit A [Geoalkalibacter halelectricus]MDO3378160.1 F0F1 ATP synthase subunit A [Geoalkalibacter halelectricus]UWZ78006.1 F0F1 ATP synthase subunit A [Geoalkalibacter halelectricus]
MIHPFLFLEWLADLVNLHVGEHVLYAWLAMALLVALAFAAGRNLKTIPQGLQNLMEVIIGAILDLMEQIMGPKGRTYLPLIATLALFILTCNLLGLVPSCFPATANVNTNLAMAATVVVLSHIVGFKEHGLHYLKHFVGPVWWLAPIMIPIEVIGHIARLVSLTLRLFGNMFGKEVVLMIFLTLVPFLLPVPMMMLGLLIAFIQTFVFTLLAMIYLAGALEEAH